MNITVENETHKVTNIKVKEHEVVLCTDNGEYTFTWKEYGEKTHRKVITIDNQEVNVDGNANKYSKILPLEKVINERRD